MIINFDELTIDDHVTLRVLVNGECFARRTLSATDHRRIKEYSTYTYQEIVQDLIHLAVDSYFTVPHHA
jgi:hypothetical protein